MTTETMLMAKQIVARSMNWPNRNNGSKFRTGIPNQRADALRSTKWQDCFGAIFLLKNIPYNNI